VVANSLLSQKKKVRVVGRDDKKLTAFTSRGAKHSRKRHRRKISDASVYRAEAVYAMIPPDINQRQLPRIPESRQQRDRQGARERGVKHAVTLSSFGADKAEKTGPIAGLHELESKLNLIKD